MGKEITFQTLPDTIGVTDYMEWRKCGRATADAIFHARGFPRIKNTGSKLIADKRAVLLYELGLNEEDKKEILKEIAREIIAFCTKPATINDTNETAATVTAYGICVET